MDPNREGFSSGGQDFPEDKQRLYRTTIREDEPGFRPLGPDAQVVERGIVGQDYVKGEPDRHLPEEENIEQAQKGV